jgi:16S rRNA (cytosine967-C5)-methyltransferase
VLQPLVTAEWTRVQPDLKDVLRIGAYQILRLDRIPAHAAVETAVELAKVQVSPGAAGLVNAVLRKLAKAPVTPPATPSHPRWLVRRWEQAFGRDRTAALLAHNDARPSLVIQPARWSAAQLAAALEGFDVRFTQRESGFAIEGARVEDLPGFNDGAFLVQDPAQTRVLEHAAFPDGSLVWDACAAPGGKAVLLARRARVLASDVSPARIQRLRENAHRIAPGLAIFSADARRPPLADGSLDGVLLDAPCSATGTIARHPDARWKLTRQRIALMVELQAELLDAMARLVRPGGVLVYATCSLEPEENEQQVNGFLMRHPEFRRTVADLFVFPPDSGTDGAFASRLERTA